MVRSEDNNLFGMAKSTLEESIVLFEVAICSAATIARSSSSPFAAKLTKQRFDIFFDLGVILLSRLFVFRDAFNARGKEREKEEEEKEYIVIVDGSLQIKERERERDCFLCCLCVCVQENRNTCRCIKVRAPVLQKNNELLVCEFKFLPPIFSRFCVSKWGEKRHKEARGNRLFVSCAQVAFFSIFLLC